MSSDIVIAEALILIEAEKEIDRLRAHIVSQKQEIERLKQERDAFHSIAHDFWVYGKCGTGKYDEWNKTLARYDDMELSIGK